MTGFGGCDASGIRTRLARAGVPRGAGVYLAGELVEVDHVNRRGAIRLVGDTDDSRYHSAPSHRFAMLPFGSLRYHGAHAELRRAAPANRSSVVPHARALDLDHIGPQVG